MNLRTRLVIDEMARHRVQFEHLCRSLTPAELATLIPHSPWNVKDYIAHLCTIDGLIAAGFSPMVGLTAPAPDVPMPQPFDIDEWNEAVVKTREDRSIEELLAEGASHRADFVAAVEKLTDDDLDRIIPYGGDRKTLNLQPSMVRFGGLLWGIAIHDPTHTRDILRALPRRAEESWISEWLASVNDSQVPSGVREQRV
jgi:hypothetical protein